jgi:hypothetical protein
MSRETIGPEAVQAAHALDAENMLALGWTIRPPRYNPGYTDRRWVHDDYTNELEVSIGQFQWLVNNGVIKHHGGWLWEGEHENNGPSWWDGDDGGLHLQTREIYEVIDPELPYNRRFRTLRQELLVSNGGGDDYQLVTVRALTSRQWLELSQMAIGVGLEAQARGL